MEEYYYINADVRRLTHQVLFCIVSFCLLQFPPARHQNETNCQLQPSPNVIIIIIMSRSPPTARCRPARRRSPQGRAGATVDEHGLRFYGFLSETMECGVRAAASYISCRYQSPSQRGLSCRMLLVSVPCQWWGSWYNKLNYIEVEMMTMAIYR